MLHWIPVNSRLCVVYLDGSVRVNSSRLKCRCFFVAFVYESTECNYPEAKGDSCREIFFITQRPLLLLSIIMMPKFAF